MIVRRGRGARTVLLSAVALLASTLTLVGSATTSDAHEGHAHPEPAVESVGAVSELPPGFQDRVAIGGLTQPTAVAFAPDGTAFVSNQAGIIKTFDYAGGAFDDPAPVDFADLTTPVMNYWDRGMVGLVVDPQFPARPYVYVSYTLNRDPRDNPAVTPRWGLGEEGSPYYDNCPQPAALPATTGCVAMIQVSRLTAARTPEGWVMPPGGEKVLVSGGCLQFPSHGSGSLAFGPDGKLYATVGEGASFDFADHGQVGNPCGDPVDEGGSLRSQDLRTPGDPTTLNGVLIRIDPDTGLSATGSNDNADRIVAYGLRNPWRIAFRPATSEVWVADVGAGSFDEINRVTGATAVGATKPNYGWPCYEGPVPNAEWQGLAKPLCTSLYAAQDSGAGATSPVLAYAREGEVVPGDGCPTGTASVSGVAFVPTTSSYPAAYRGRLVFSDFARKCLWSSALNPDGSVQAGSTHLLVGAASTPVDVKAGPGGDLYYVDYGTDAEGTPTSGLGQVHRIVYSATNQQPTASFTPSATYGPAPLAVSFDASGSSDPDGDPLTYAWDLDGNGSYETSGVTATRTYTASTNVTVGLRVADGSGGTGTAQQVISPGNTAPAIASMTTSVPATGWTVGQTVSFAAAAGDLEDDPPLPGSAYSWNLSIQHCPSICHTHPLTTFAGQAGSFTAPDHEYPSHLLLKLTVTDSRGVAATRTLQLDPRAVTLQFQSSPAGVPLTIGTASVAPTARTFIVGSRFTASAPAIWTGPDGVARRFAGWNDGGALSHEILAPSTPATYVATYVPINPPPPPAASATLTLRTGPGKLKVVVDGKARRATWKRDHTVGTVLVLKAPRLQWRTGTLYVFKRWSDKRPRKHAVTVPSGGLVLKAVYRRKLPSSSAG